jgi:hypothetical protein
MSLPRIIGAVILAGVIGVGCSGGNEAPVLSTGPDGTGTATLTLKSGDTWVVTLPEGSSEVYDLYGNDGSDPIDIWQESPITMPEGVPFAIALAAPTTRDGVWRATGGTADGTVLAPLQQGVNPYDIALPGSDPGVHYFVYRGTAAGTGTLEFGLFPPDADTPQESRSFDVTITAAR